MTRTLLVLNDLHLGVQRAAGTTPASANALRVWLHDQHDALINDSRFAEHDLVYNGDLFDQFMVPLADAIRVADSWHLWLSNHPGNIHVGRGNHDISKDSSRVSMFDFVCAMMKSNYPTRFFSHIAFGQIGPDVFILPHCINQEEFDRELSRALTTIPSSAILLLHANYDNQFSANSDHSLSVTIDQAKWFNDKGCKLLFGHEHAHKLDTDTGVYITGNQFPTSISDLIESPVKYFAEIAAGEITISPMPYDDTLLQEVDWKSVGELKEYGRFIKVVGKVAAIDNVLAVEVVSKLRADAIDTFVVTNGVHVVQPDEVGGSSMEMTGEEIRAVNVFEFLYEQLEPEQAAVVRALVEKQNA